MTELADELPVLEVSSLRRRATDVLRSAIVEGRLQPGGRLKEVELAEQLGVSRAPVREALRQLEYEGLVVSSPYRGTEVRGITQDEIVEVLVPIRVTIESFAFRRALPMLSETDLQTLEKLVDDMWDAARRGDVDRLAEDDMRFHALVLERSGQPHCQQMWQSIEARVRTWFRRDAPAHARVDEVPEQHEELLRAIRTGDETIVIETLIQHINFYLGLAGDGARE